jgi:hypothetical protein
MKATSKVKLPRTQGNRIWTLAGYCLGGQYGF